MKSNILVILLIACFISGCKDAEMKTNDFPFLVTKPVSEIDANGATFEAAVAISGKDNVTDYGFIWNNSSTEFKISLINKSDLKEFKTRIKSDLILNQTYSCKAYIVTTKNLVYGNTVTFKSLGSTLPEILDFNPKEGFDGDTVKLRGHYFSSLKENNKVFVNNMQANIISSNDSSIIFITPMQSFSGMADIAVEVNFIRTTAQSKYNIFGPEISSISSLSEFSGSQVTLTGKNFFRSGSSLSVLFGNYNAEIISVSSTKIVVRVPIAKDNLLGVSNVTIKLVFGQKTTTYSSGFLIKDSWQTKSPPLTFAWPTVYQDGLTYKDKGYMLDINYLSLYEYNPSANSWSQYGTTVFPGDRYQGSLYLVSGNKLFKVGGNDYMFQQSIISDVWAFYFISKSWTKKNNIPFQFSYATSFNLDNQFYVLTYEGQLWQCDFENEQYKRLKDFPAQFNDYFVSSFIANGNAYAVQYGKTWMYDKLNNNWILKSGNIFSLEQYYVGAKCFTLNNTGYVLNKGTDLYKYDYVNNVWILVSFFPGPQGFNSEKSFFVIGNSAYIAATSSNYQGGSPLMYSYQE
jgi:hypothetical protein